MRCPNGCGAEYIRADQEDHLTTCPAKPILCQWCGEMVPRNRIDVSMLQLYNVMGSVTAIQCNGQCSHGALCIIYRSI